MYRYIDIEIYIYIYLWRSIHTQTLFGLDRYIDGWIGRFIDRFKRTQTTTDKTTSDMGSGLRCPWVNTPLLPL